MQADVFIEIVAQRVRQDRNGFTVANAAERGHHRRANVAFRFFLECSRKLRNGGGITQYRHLFGGRLPLFRTRAVQRWILQKKRREN